MGDSGIPASRVGHDPGSLAHPPVDTGRSPGSVHTFRASDPLPHLYEAWQWLRGTPGAWREFRELR